MPTLAETVTVWDGLFMRFMTRDDALVAQANGLVQIFDGPNGYQPGFRMYYQNEFPFTSGVFYPTDVFDPDSKGGFFCPNKIETLFSDRAWTVPITDVGSDLGSILNQFTGYPQFNMRRPVSGAGRYVYTGLALRTDVSNQFGMLQTASANLGAGFEQITLIMCARVSAPPASNNIQLEAIGHINTSGTSGVETFPRANTNSATNTLRGTFYNDPVNNADYATPNSPVYGKVYAHGIVCDSNETTQQVFMKMQDGAMGIGTINSPYLPTIATNSQHFIRTGVGTGQELETFGWLIVDKKLPFEQIEELADWFIAYATTFNPDDLFGVNDRGGVFDVNDMSRYYQDPDGLVPITALGQAVLSFRPRNNDDLYVVFGSFGDWIYTQDINGFRCLSYMTPASGIYSKSASHLFTDGLFNSGTFVGTSAGQVEEFATPFFGANCGIYSPADVYGMYAYGGTSVAGGEVYASIRLYGDTQSTPIPPEIPVDGVPSVFSWRCQTGEQTVQVNRGDEFVHDAPYVETETTGGDIDIFCYEYSRWYGGVAINRYLTDAELAPTQQWSATLADVTL